MTPNELADALSDEAMLASKRAVVLRALPYRGKAAILRDTVADELDRQSVRLMRMFAMALPDDPIAAPAGDVEIESLIADAGGRWVDSTYIIDACDMFAFVRRLAQPQRQGRAVAEQANEYGEPEVIYLQLHGDGLRNETKPDDYKNGDVTWCWHRIYGQDVKYIRADIYTEQPASDTAERLKDRRWALENSYGNGSFRDGQITGEILAIDAQLAGLKEQPASAAVADGIPDAWIERVRTLERAFNNIYHMDEAAGGNLTAQEALNLAKREGYLGEQAAAELRKMIAVAKVLAAAPDRSQSGGAE